MTASSLSYIFPFPYIFSSTLDSEERAFAYAQPSVVTLLVVLSFLFVLNASRKIADYVLYAGIIAEIGMGMVYGAPLAAILPAEWESTFTVLGYLGLIGIVFEGGLSTNLPLLLSNLVLSTLCAAVGIALPVAFSFALLAAGYGYTRLEAFAAGAALSSTSLGTTLMALNSVERAQPRSSRDGIADDKGKKPEADEVPAGRDEAISPPLQHTRIGTVLVSAAVLDDVIGLVLSSLIPSLSILQNGTDAGAPRDTAQTSIAWTVVRPLLSSFLMATITPLVARFMLRPLFWWRGVGERWCAPRRAGKPWGLPSSWLARFGSGPGASAQAGWGTEAHADAVKVTVSVLFVSAFASIAYYTGSSVLFGAYLAGLTLTYISRPPASLETPFPVIDGSVNSDEDVNSRTNALSFEDAYGRTIGPLQNHVFAPLFFASIGYAIPFISLWKPVILWRGVLYALLMTVGKLAAGLPVILWTILPGPRRLYPATLNRLIRRLPFRREHIFSPRQTADPALDATPGPERPPFRSALAPAAFMGIAMVSRGEIGLLIAQIARNGPAAGGGLLGDEAFLVCVWAILLCTLVGPIGVGFVVRRWEGDIRSGIWG